MSLINNKFNEYFQNYVDISDINNTKDENILRGRQLAAFSICITSDISYQKAATCITDGSKDNGIDAIYVDNEKKVIYFVQSKWTERESSSISQGDTLKFISGIEKIIELNFETFNDKILKQKTEIERALNDVFSIKVIIIYSSNYEIAEICLKELEKLKKKINEDSFDILSYSIIKQKQIYDYIAKGTSNNSINLENVCIENYGNVQMNDSIVCYYGTISIEQVWDWWKDNKEKLFDKNIRNYKGNTLVNKKIIETLKNEPQNFILYNNGIKMLAKNIIKVPVNSTAKNFGIFNLKNISIVNGAQTVGCIGSLSDDAAKKKASVFVQIISLENLADGLDKKITMNSNTQNRIEFKDFASQDPLHEKLYKDFLIDNIDYKYKEGANNDNSRKNITLDDIAIAIGCYRDNIQISTTIKGNYGKLFENLEKGFYKEIFNQSLTTYEAWNAVSFYKMYEKYTSALKDKILTSDTKYKYLVHANRFILYCLFQIAKKSIKFTIQDYKKPTEYENVIKNGIEPLLDKIESARNKLYKDSYVANIFKNNTKTEKLYEELII
ncbi:AIPR family protein [Treponema pectinovorum]|uniref:AIPR family protein n=1 Tax=Treponema pectinovorum TaxID=164 RepID=UPI0011CB933E|nr:AIPR family protein [Treponema pectinovorum]